MFRKSALVCAAIVLAVWGAFVVAPEPAYEQHQPDAAYRAAAADYLVRNLTPMPEGWRWNYHTAADGKKMRWGSAAPEGPVRGTVIFVPGFAGALEMYADYHHALLARGYQVYGFDLRGQGGSDRMLANPEKPWISDFGIYADDLAGFVDQVRQQVDGPLVLMGESFGGHVSLRAVGDHALDVDGLMLVAPAMKILTPYGYQTSRLMVEAGRKLGFGERYAPMQANWQPFVTDLNVGNYCGNVAERVHIKDALYTERPEIRVGGTTNQWVAEIMESGARISRPAYLAQVDMPIVMVTGDDDPIVDAAVNMTACETDMVNCRLLVIEDTGHCLISEPAEARQRMFDALDEMIAALAASI